MDRQTDRTELQRLRRTIAVPAFVRNQADQIDQLLHWLFSVSLSVTLSVCRSDRPTELTAAKATAG